MTATADARDVCPGCGREVADDPVACPGCGRALARGAAVPPGWGLSAPGTATLPRIPRWRLAGIETARPPEGPEDTVPQFAPGLFLATSPPDGEDGEEPMRPGGPGWRIRERGTRVAAWSPPTAGPHAGVAATAGAATLAATPSTSVPAGAWRAVYWLLVGGILATSSAAVLLLTLHLVRGR